MQSIFDINKDLRKAINKFSDTSGINGVAVPLLIEYNTLVQTAKALCSPIEVMKSDISEMLDTTPVMDSIANISRTLDILNSGLVKSKLTIDSAGVEFYNEIYDSVPDAMKGEISTDINNSVIEIPAKFFVELDSVQSRIKEDALQLALDSSSKAFLFPLETYRNYIKSVGLINIIKTMQQNEKFLMETCGKDKRELFFTGTKKYNSQYYMNLICMTFGGDILLGKIKSDFKSLSISVNKILNKKDSFIF